MSTRYYNSRMNAERLARTLATRLFEVGDEPSRSLCYRINFRGYNNEDLGGFVFEALNSWLLEELEKEKHQ